MTTPASLAEIRTWVDKETGQCPHKDCKGCAKGRSILALVELAEAYLETRPGIHDSCRDSCKNPAQCEAKRQAAHDRLVLAAKGVRP